MIDKSFGKKINQKRKELNIKTDKLAEACDIDAGYMRQVIGGKVPSSQVILKLCEVLNLSPNYLFEFTEDGQDKELFEKINKLSPKAKKILLNLLDSYIQFEENES